MGMEGRVKEKDIIELLEYNYLTFFKEFNSIDDKLLYAWPETEIYTGEWLTFGLYFKNQLILPNVDLCPKSIKILDTIPSIVNAGFSILKPKTDIKPHVGYSNKVYRYHLGINIPSSNPDNCALCIYNPDIIKTWQNGKAFKFDDCKLHSAYNHTDKNRVILLIDVLK